jgi:putative transposase
MGRPKRAVNGGSIYLILRCGNARTPIFEKAGDYEAFARILEEAVERYVTELQAS